MSFAGPLGLGPATLSVSTADAGFAGINFGTIETILLTLDTGAMTGNDIGFDNFQSNDVPEPATMVLVGLPLVAVGLYRRRKQRANA